jgi:hypothetical protein
MAIALFVVLLVGGSYAINKIFSDMAVPRTRPTTAQPANPTLASQSTPAPDGSLRPATEGHAPIDTSPPPPTPAEIREQQRRADEAARIIAPTTPEM